MTWHTVTVAQPHLDQLLLSIRRAAGLSRTAFPAPTDTPSSRTELMKLDIPSPEQAAELIAWWRQAFEALNGLEA
jgi:hypothetical protein